MYISYISSDETERNMLDFVFGCGRYGDGWKQKNVWVQTVHIQEKKRCKNYQSSTNFRNWGENKQVLLPCTYIKKNWGILMLYLQDRKYKNAKALCDTRPECLAKYGAEQSACVRKCISEFCYNELYAEDPVSYFIFMQNLCWKGGTHVPR